MIEVEKKFILTPEQEKKLTNGAEFLGEKRFTDTYYDDDGYVLTRSDIWLRSRDGKFELKIPRNESLERRVSDQYVEVVDDKEILRHLNGGPHDVLEDFLAEKGYKPFCEITTVRKKYRKDGFAIDLDVMDFGYEVAEIELMTDDGSKMKDATRRIIAFAEHHGIDTGKIAQGKVGEYLRRNSPRHFQALVDARVMK